MALWRSVVGKLWATIILLVAFVLFLLSFFLLPYIDVYFSSNSYEIKRLFVIVGIIGFLLTTFFAFFLSTKITQPLLQLKRAADLITEGKFDTRVYIRSSDEIGQLAAAFNLMGEKLEETIRDLHYEKDHLASILGSMTDAVVTLRADGTIISSNPHGERMLASWRSLLTANGEEPGRKGAKDENCIPAPLEEVFQAVVAEEKEVTTRLHVGNGVWSVVMSPLYTAGTLRGAVAVLRDVTEEAKLEKVRRDFLANVSHELRTPLSMLQGYSEAILDNIVATPEEIKEMVQVIHEESLRMGRLVQDLLDLTRFTAGRIELNEARTPLMPLLERMHRKFSAIARDSGVVFSFERKSPPESLVLESADEDKLEQVLTNLLDNAFRHTPPGKKIVLSVERLELEQGPMVRLAVMDEGDGIPEEDLPYVFERFYKADKSRKRASGTGLGLAIVKSLVEAHRGTVSVSSRIGQGTTFTVTLPVAEDAVVVETRR